MLGTAQRFTDSGVSLIVLLALSDYGQPAYDDHNAKHLATLGCPVFTCTPDQFPAMMAVALQRGDVHTWAAGEDIGLIR